MLQYWEMLLLQYWEIIWSVITHDEISLHKGLQFHVGTKGIIEVLKYVMIMRE